MREAKIDRPVASFTIFDGEATTRPVIGRLAAVGFTDDINDRHFVVVDGMDGKVHYADIARVRPDTLPGRGAIVSLDVQHPDSQSTQDKQRARLRVLSYLNLERLTATEGLTWLDRELASKSPAFVNDQGFGSDVKSAYAIACNGSQSGAWLSQCQMAALGPPLLPCEHWQIVKSAKPLTSTLPYQACMPPS